MKPGNQNSIKIPNLHDWVDRSSLEIVAAFSTLPVNAEVSDKIGRLMAQACEGRGRTLDSMFEYLSAAHGLHGASMEARRQGDEKWADELFELGQLFLHYAVGDIAAISQASCKKISDRLH
jgi:hypothetical protein